MREQHIATIYSEFFCFWLLAWKQQLIHSFLISVNIIFLRILEPIDWCICSMYTAHLILMSDIFWAAVGLYDVAVFDVFASYSSTLHTSLERIQGFSLMVTTHNSTTLKVNDMTEDILFVVLFPPKKFCIQSSDTKRSISLCSEKITSEKKILSWQRFCSQPPGCKSLSHLD